MRQNENLQTGLKMDQQTGAARMQPAGQRQKPAWKQAEGKAIIYAQIPLKIAKIKRIIRMLCKSGNRHGQIVSLKANEDTSQSFKDTIKKKQRKSPMAGVGSQPEQLKNRQERTSQ